MAYIFELAKPCDVSEIFSIIAKRVEWMEEKGLKQWNTTDYLNVYPSTYFMEHQKHGRLYKMFNSDTKEILGVMVLLDKDPRWDGHDYGSAYYVHNFATRINARGIGSLMLSEAEDLAARHGKQYLRLDCPLDNTYLNDFYQCKDYIPVGFCVDGPYRGTLREKKLEPTYTQLLEVMFSRSSYRGPFKNIPVPRSHLETIIRAGMAAPSGCNCQTTSFIAVDDEEKLNVIKQAFPKSSCQSATAFILVFTQEIPGIDGRLYNVEDYAAAIENMLLAIKVLGYESCWYQGSVRSCAEYFEKLFNVPEHFSFVCLLPVGVAAQELKPGPEKLSFEQRAWFNYYNNN